MFTKITLITTIVVAILCRAYADTAPRDATVRQWSANRQQQRIAEKDVIQPTITFETRDTDNGAAGITISFKKTKGLGVVIRVLSVNPDDKDDKIECDPYGSMTGGLDVRDPSDLSAMFDAPMMYSGIWKVVDNIEDTTRSFSTVLSPALVRQHISSIDNSLGAVAVSGGSVAVRVRACMYKIVPQSGSGAEVVAADHIDLITKDGKTVGPDHMDASIVSVTEEPDNSVTVVLETRVSVAARSKSPIPRSQIVPGVSVSARSGPESRGMEVSVAGQRTKMHVSGIKKISSWCSGSDEANNCIQRWSVSVPKDSIVSAVAPKGSKRSSIDSRLVDLVFSFVASSLLGDNKEQTQFAVHARAPIPMAAKAGKSADPRLSAVVRIDGVPEQRVHMGKSRRSEQAITMRNADLACIDLTVDGTENAGKIEVVKADMIVCEGEKSDCERKRSLPMIRNGRVANDFARNARGSIRTSAEGDTRLCYKPAASHQGTVVIQWAAKNSERTAKQAREAPVHHSWNNHRPEVEKDDENHDCIEEGRPPREGDEHRKPCKPKYPPVHFPWMPHPELPEWCNHGHGCNGTISFDTHVMCDHDEIYDPTFHDCVSDTEYEAGAFVAFLIIGLFVIIMFGIIAMVFIGASGYW